MVATEAERNARVAAIILAAGRSTRMGQAKQLLRLGSTTILGRTIENVRRSAVGEIVLVLGSNAGAVRRQIPIGEDVRVVVNREYAQGMASSLRAGLAALFLGEDTQVDAALVVLADQPFVRPETLDQLANAHRRSNAEFKAQIVIPTYKGLRGNPVLLDHSVFSEVMALEGDIGCRAIFGSHAERIVKVEVEDAGILLDIDSRQDYQRLRGLGQSGPAEEKRRETLRSIRKESPPRTGE